MRSTKSLCFFTVSPSFLEPKLMTGSRSSTWENIRFSITSRIFSYDVQAGLRPPLEARLRRANFTTSLRKSFGLAMPAGFSILVNSAFSSSRFIICPVSGSLKS